MNDLLDLQEPLLDGGIRSINFFNGRLLTGRDLTREQQARRTADWRLGEALGEGVAFGLEIEDPTPDPEGFPVLEVGAGAAVNRAGQVLRLTKDTPVRLIRPPQIAATPGTVFGECRFVEAGHYIGGAGLYVLTLAPAEASDGTAPANGLDPLNVRCNTDVTIEALQFRMVHVRPALYASAGAADARFRNDLAHLAFGTADAQRWIAHPYGPPLERYGLVDAMRDEGLTDCDVPLALVYMTSSKTVRFVDRGSVRREIHARPRTPAFVPLVHPRRLAEGHAMFLQFQEQVAGFRVGDHLEGITARSHFRRLPPVGIIPVKPDADEETHTEALRFFEGLTCRGPTFINGAKLGALVRDAAAFPPIDLASGECLWIHRVRENAPARRATGLAPPPQQYVVFANGQMPYLGDARFDLAYWNNANYALHP